MLQQKNASVSKVQVRARVPRTGTRTSQHSELARTSYRNRSKGVVQKHTAANDFEVECFAAPPKDTNMAIPRLSVDTKLPFSPRGLMPDIPLEASCPAPVAECPYFMLQIGRYDFNGSLHCHAFALPMNAVKCWTNFVSILERITGEEASGGYFLDFDECSLLDFEDSYSEYLAAGLPGVTWISNSGEGYIWPTYLHRVPEATFVGGMA